MIRVEDWRYDIGGIERRKEEIRSESMRREIISTNKKNTESSNVATGLASQILVRALQ